MTSVIISSSPRRRVKYWVLSFACGTGRRPRSRCSPLTSAADRCRGPGGEDTRAPGGASDALPVAISRWPVIPPTVAGRRRSMAFGVFVDDGDFQAVGRDVRLPADPGRAAALRPRLFPGTGPCPGARTGPGALPAPAVAAQPDRPGPGGRADPGSAAPGL